jgi:hypothetical protein
MYTDAKCAHAPAPEPTTISTTYIYSTCKLSFLEVLIQCTCRARFAPAGEIGSVYPTYDYSGNRPLKP